MLDEKIESGPDYDSASEQEKAVEAARLRALLKDWEIASSCSRSHPPTPIRRHKVSENVRGAGMESVRYVERNPSASMVHQSYGVVQPNYRQTTSYTPIYQQHNAMMYSSAMQYQALSPMYVNQPPYPKHYPSYTQHGSPIKIAYQSNSVKHIPYDQPQINFSPSHKVYTNVPKSSAGLTNGELIVQQQIYNQQIQYQQTREYQQYRQSKEQMLLQQQQQTYQAPRNYQSSVHIPIVMHTPQTDASPLHRKQYQMT